MSDSTQGFSNLMAGLADSVETASDADNIEDGREAGDDSEEIRQVLAIAEAWNSSDEASDATAVPRPPTLAGHSRTAASFVAKHPRPIVFQVPAEPRDVVRADAAVSALRLTTVEGALRALSDGADAIDVLQALAGLVAAIEHPAHAGDRAAVVREFMRCAQGAGERE